LLAAWRLARQHDWWPHIAFTMQSLRVLYEDTRNAVWRRMVEAVVSHFIDPATGGPLAGREEVWTAFTDYRVGLARREHSWAEAKRIQRISVDFDRERARQALETAPEAWNDKQRNTIRNLIVSLQRLGEIQLEKSDPACAGTYREALDLADAIGDPVAQAVCAFDLSKAYARKMTALRDLDEAERLARKSLDLRLPADVLGRSKSLAVLGMVFMERFEEAQAAKRPIEEVVRYIAEAEKLYEAVLETLPKTAIADRGIAHNQLGAIYMAGGIIDRALHHFQEAIRYKEEAGNRFSAGRTRSNVATTLLTAGRADDARAYAEAALADFQIFGERALGEIQLTKKLIADIDKALAVKR
jgi:tetratricopeptide (TPR) repeat protein